MPDEKIVAKPLSFFPVTAFIKGQIHDIKEKGITPMLYSTSNNHTDSAAIKFEALDTLLKEFLQPVIDTTNLIAYFTENKFLDQSINAFTFTYDAKPNLPDSIKLTHWDVYIDPETNKVKRVYMIKKNAGNKTVQLTWLSNLWCQTTTLANNTNGSFNVVSEEKILWQ